MKIYLSLLLLFSVIPSKKELSFSNFDSELNQIVNEFKMNIMDKNKCEDLKRKASYLSDDIEDAIEEEQNSSEEKVKLTKLKQEVDAVEEFISSVGNGGNNMFAKMDDINLANRRINASISQNTTDKYCCKILKVTIQGYVATMLYNNSNVDLKVTYKWQTSNKSNSGSGEMGLPRETIRQVYNNRDSSTQKNTIFTSVKCNNI